MTIDLTRFSPGPLTDAQLNALVDAITAKFNGGVTTSDVASPLKLPGNLDMNSFEILNLYKLWNTRNLAERASGVSVQTVFDEINTAGGGVILLPADTTETLGTSGVSVGANTLIVGEGESSVFATTGTITNHMFRNKVNGDSGIHFVNLKIDNSGASSGNFEGVGFTRTSRCKFTDVLFAVGRRRGVLLTTDSASNPCDRTSFNRCTWLLTGTATAGLHMTDVSRVNVMECDFTQAVASSVGIQYSATGATSKCDRISIVDNEWVFTTGATQKGVEITAPATNGVKQLHVDQNSATSATATVSPWIDIVGSGTTLMSASSIDQNTYRSDGTTATAVIRIRSLRLFSICNNIISTDGTAIGILIGADARSGTAAGCAGFVADSNVISTDETCMAFCHPAGTDNFQLSVISNNSCIMDNAGTGNYEIWNLQADPTTFVMQLTIVGNNAGGSSVVGTWACYTGVGATGGGRAGNANNSFLILQGNVTVGTLVGNSAGDYFRETDVATRKCLTDTDDAGTATDNLR